VFESSGVGERPGFAAIFVTGPTALQLFAETREIPEKASGFFTLTLEADAPIDPNAAQRAALTKLA